MAAREDYIALCRYYKGEDENPLSGEKALLWDYEETWVDMHMSEDPFLADYVGDYVSAGLATFSLYDGVPVTLQALLFNRFCYGLWGEQYEYAERFKEWYSSNYL